jgi:pimeloyl-ACP methyl ester carboxylesterase
LTNSPIIVGNGSTRVIALHGWFGDASGWGPFPDLIDRETSSWAFMNCWRGYGDRKDVAGEFTNAEIAADLEVADRLEWQDFALVGHSMGGKAIQRVYADAPDQVTVMIGIAPIHADPFPFDDAGWALFLGAAESERTGTRSSTSRPAAGTARPGPTGWSATPLLSTKEAFSAYLYTWGRMTSLPSYRPMIIHRCT